MILNLNKRISDFFSLEDFKDSIPLAALGARTCYNKGTLEDLLNDPRITDVNERAEFLKRLALRKHFSVFAHSFAYKNVGIENALVLAAKYFKTEYNVNYPEVIGVSLRHLIEELPEEKYDRFFKEMAKYDVAIEPLGQKDHVTLLYLNPEYDGYAVFFLDHVSRVMTHQLVRHTALNYSQRSQRYIPEYENYTIVPESISKDKLAMYYFENAEKHAVATYLQLLDLKIKKEDARFILPHGRRTTIVVSGTLRWIYDFIEKRKIPAAQWEIRQVAKEMEELLSERGLNKDIYLD